MDTLVYSPLRKNQALATKKLLPCQCTVTAISHTIQPKTRWQNAAIARSGSIKPAKKFLEKFSTIKGFNESAITAKLLRHRHQFFFRQMVIENIIDCQFLCGHQGRCIVATIYDDFPFASENFPCPPRPCYPKCVKLKSNYLG